MALTRADKTNLIEKLSDNLKRGRGVVFTEYRGMTMNNLTALREKLHAEGIEYRVVKTTLLRLAMKKEKLSVPEEMLDLPLAVAFGFDDEVAPAKIVAEVAKEIEALKIMGGFVNGQFVDATDMKRLANLPSREQLYGQVVGTIAAPLTNLVGVLQGNIRGLVTVLQQYQSKIS